MAPDPRFKRTPATRGAFVWRCLALPLSVFLLIVVGRLVAEWFNGQLIAGARGSRKTTYLAGDRDVAHQKGHLAVDPGAGLTAQREEVLERSHQPSEGVLKEKGGCVLGVGARAKTGRVACCGHRGSRLVAPENTIPAFQKALEVGANCVEMDVHLTRDGHLAVVHGGHMRQHLLPPPAAAGGAEDQRRVEDMTWAEVRNLSAGAWLSPSFASTRVPRLEEAMAALWGKKALLILDLKTDPCPRKSKARCPKPGDLEKKYAAALHALLTANTTAALRAAGVPSPSKSPAFIFMLSSFNHPLVNRLSASLAKIEGPQPSTLIPRLAGLGYILHPVENATGEGFDDRVKWLAPHVGKVKDPAVARLRKRHPRISAWVSDDLKVGQELAGLGVEAIITNDPTICPKLCPKQEQRA